MSHIHKRSRNKPEQYFCMSIGNACGRVLVQFSHQENDGQNSMKLSTKLTDTEYTHE